MGSFAFANSGFYFKPHILADFLFKRRPKSDQKGNKSLLKNHGLPKKTVLGTLQIRYVYLLGLKGGLVCLALERGLVTSYPLSTKQSVFAPLAPGLPTSPPRCVRCSPCWGARWSCWPVTWAPLLTTGSSCPRGRARPATGWGHTTVWQTTWRGWVGTLCLGLHIFF